MRRTTRVLPLPLFSLVLLLVPLPRSMAGAQLAEPTIPIGSRVRVSAPAVSERGAILAPVGGLILGVLVGVPVGAAVGSTAFAPERWRQVPIPGGEAR